MDVNDHERLSNVTIRYKVTERCFIYSSTLYMHCDDCTMHSFKQSETISLIVLKKVILTNGCDKGRINIV